MYEAFPGNYWWSAMVLNALGMGGEMTEIDRAVAALTAESQTPAAPGSRAAWRRTWHRLGRDVRSLGDRDLSDGLHASARRKLLRAAAYMFVAEVIDAAHDGDPDKLATYTEAQHAFADGISLELERVELVEIPFENTSLPAVYVHPGGGQTAPAPCMVHFDGRDDVKEVTYLRHRFGLAQRGIGMLIVDHPGSGEAVRRRGLYARPDIEVAATACVEFLAARPEVDEARIGIIAQSFGGYYAPRSAAREPRLAVCVVWGALWDAAAVVTQTGVPLDPANWRLLGPLADETAVLARLHEFSLDPVIEELRCPLLVIHGADDRQVPLWAAETTVARAVNARSTELRVFTAEEGASEHCGVDLLPNVTDFIADWLDRFFHHEGSHA